MAKPILKNYQQLKAHDKLKYLSVRNVMEHMKTLAQVRYSRTSKAMLTETSPLQQLCISNILLPLPHPCAILAF